jgi:hypothetical protein
MRRFVIGCSAGLAVLAVLALWGSSARAQGVTGSAVTGTVTGEGVGAVEAAEVQLRNPATGEVFGGITDAQGRYFLDNVASGGPYTLSVSASGYPVTSKGGITLNLGQRLTVDMELKFKVEEIVIVEQVDPLQDHGHTGVSTTVRDTTINRTPLLGRNFTDLLSTAPQVSGTSIAGQNNRYNNIQIDGGANNDLFGLSGSGTPGGLSGSKALSLEAIKEFVIQVAPFDVRQGNFTGGLVNAVTKSGTNEFHGAAFTYYQNKSLTDQYDPRQQPYVDDPSYQSFHSIQYGASVGGPIIKDKLHFFVSADLQSRAQSFGSQYQITGDDTADMKNAGFTKATADQFVQILKDKYNITGVGDASAPDINNPDANVFGKLSWNIDEKNRLEVSYNFVKSSLDVLGRTPTDPSLPDPNNPNAFPSISSGYQLSGSGYTIANSTNTLRFKLTSRFGNGDVSNEALGSVSIIRDARNVPTNAPLIIVDTGGKLGSKDSFLAAGGERFSQANQLDQDIYQIQDNVTFGLGDHRITVGTSDEFLKIRNLFLQAAYGAWIFASMDDFMNGNAAAYQRRVGLVAGQDPGTAKFNASEIGLYVQDEWSPIKNVTLTPGIRLDVPFLSGGNPNPDLLTIPFPIDTTQVPSANLLWAPRLGFNWDVEGTADTIVRGGVGVFSGRPPYVWIANQYSLNGLSQTEIDCPTKTVGAPKFNPDPSMAPSDCSGGTGMPSAPKPQPEIDYFDPKTRYPQNFQAVLGLDKKLPWDIIGSIDLLYSRDINGWYTTDENIEIAEAANGEGRTLYGFPTASGSIPTARIDPQDLVRAIKVFNKNGARTYTGIFQLSKRFAKSYEVSLGYTLMNSRDLMSLGSSQAISNFRFVPIDGTIKERNLRPSNFDRTHKITLTGNADLPYGFLLGLNYVGLSGTPYTYVVNGDVNGDGFSDNDTPYIPKTQADISLKGDTDGSMWQALDAFISAHDCLNGARGRLLQRGECRNPWSNMVNMRLGWGIQTVPGQRFEVQLDIFNLMNLLNKDWGHLDGVTGNESTTSTDFLTKVGYDATNDRPVYTFGAPKVIESPSLNGSRWKIQLGARYVF